ncbi:MAG TPA: SRPBCC family protein [Gordonia polyisoprenivorans]|uniref:SRPBCC family protein n=1 Tax=Gordonia TaxID=2053 RepID=UPI00037259F2|nr:MULTISPECIES: SRPBCC family protein [Gordonia]MBE7195558.1 SRPBCC family protein [Gordonia polyisoprenivorans]MDF3280710.1 SRPBCC family protein [Gordonia sp. N1V]OPX12115.1 polyketide cyclase [Gordonia sp. i37]OZC33772.1 SRPBCC family protein [Gordonia polyisoprenivorans]QTI70261.1 SRPBCC family protein [Gordonia polyisoprenivorans]
MAAPLIEESIDIDATPEQVWEVISDLKRMGEWSPQCVKMIVRGPVGLGTKTINVNRRGPLVWPTTSKIVRFSPNQELGFRVAENRTVWSYTITPTASGVTVTERREVPGGTTSTVSSVLVDKLMGGTENFEAELKLGMAETLGKIKRAVEG